MSIADLVKAAEYLTDDKGHKKVMLDWDVWKEIVTLLESTSQPKTELGRQLREARAEILASGLPTLKQEELEREIAIRRGGQQ